MFAVLPPIAGLIFKNGSLFFSDILLLGLAAVFLHWSVTAPWYVSSCASFEGQAFTTLF
jgi:hypothetical protein